MTSILPWSILAVALASTGLALLIVGYRRRAARLLIPGVLCLMASTVCAGVVVVSALRLSVDHPRTDVASPQADTAA